MGNGKKTDDKTRKQIRIDGEGVDVNELRTKEICPYKIEKRDKNES